MNEEDNLELKEMIRKTAIEVSVLPEARQIEFLKILFVNLPDDSRMRLYKKIGNMVIPELRWLKTKCWMEKRFVNDMSQTPRQLASMCMYYMKIDTVMAPKMVKLAQEVKDKLRKKYRRAQEKIINQNMDK